MPLIKTPAIVLPGSRSLGEADKLVSFYTLLHGKVSGVARASRRMKNRFGASLEPFTYSQTIFFLKRSDFLHRIRQSDILHSFHELREDLDRIQCAGRITSLTAAMTPEGESNPSLFHFLLNALKFLARDGTELAACLFEMRLLKYIGYQPRLEVRSCLRCRGSLLRSSLFLSPETGGIICRECTRRETVHFPISQGAAAFFSRALELPPALIFRLRNTLAMREELRHLLGGYYDYLQGKVRRG